MILKKAANWHLWLLCGLLGLSVATYMSYLSLLAAGDAAGDSAWTRAAPRPCGTACSVEESPHFLIHTPGCVIPDIDPDHPSIAKYKGKPQDMVCSTKRPLTATEDLFLLLLEDNLEDYGISSKASLRCGYQGIVRVEQDPKKYNGACDKKFELRESKPLEAHRTLIGEDGVLVTCWDGAEQVYQNVHYFIQPRRSRGKRKEFLKSHGQRGTRPDQLSVAIMGTDAVARGNLRRHMPKTFRFLREELDAIDLSGYVKVADNTDPNMYAVLMGLTAKEFKQNKCRPRQNAKYDDCPLIFKNFSQAGYVTAFAEDAPWMGIFHYNQVGYVKEPTDYYNRPYFQVSEKYISHNGQYGSSNGKLCQGGTPSITVIHNYSLAVAEVHRDVPYFGLFWNAAVTHDYLKLAAMADTPSLRYLKEFRDRGFNQNTVLFFISDHGLRWGAFRSTYAGMLEERMPFLFAVFPPWFKEEYPDVWRNMKKNTKRLTSTFDLHATLFDILNRAYANMTRTYSGAHGISLFREVPLNRTCEDASIPEHYCACEHSVDADPRDPKLKEVAEFSVSKLNSGLKKFPQCVQLELDEVISGRTGSARNSTTPKGLKTIISTYMVTFQTKPGGARLEATVREHDGTFELVADVSRTNKYGDQSHCVKDFVYRKYCYCKDLLPKS